MTLEQSWKKFEGDLRPILVRDDMNAEAVDWVVADLRPRWLEAALRAQGADFSDVSVEVRARINDCVGRAVLASTIQIVRLERELYELKFGRSALSPEAVARNAARVMPGPAPGAKPN